MDFDNDGIMDMISGSYDPGDLYLFRGLGDGKYAKRETLRDEDKLPLVHHPEEFTKFEQHEKQKGDHEDESDDQEAIGWRVASFGSWPAMVDWDDDDDLDMLIGSFGGGLYLRSNIGTRDKPVFSSESTRIEVDGQPLKENCHANPVVADWDGDGLWDLVTGSGDGSVGWYQNVGTHGSPRFGARSLLVPPAANVKFLQQTLAAGESPVPGVRAQICVTDYNHDGLLDLIVGDYSDIDWTRELSDEESKQMEDILASQQELIKQIKVLQEILSENIEEMDEETKTAREEEYQKATNEYMKLDRSRKKFFEESRSASFLWMYERIKK